MVDYSSKDIRNISDDNHLGMRKGKHTVTIDSNLFKDFLKQTEGLNFDIMLETKDKEISALKALELVREHSKQSSENGHVNWPKLSNIIRNG
jgi:hypothetical protein